MAEVEHVASVGPPCLLGECALWDDKRQSLWWTDIEGRALHRYDWRDASVSSISLPDRLGSFALVESSSELLCAAEKSFFLLEPSTGERREICLIETGHAHTRLNDGRVDRQGRFWAGTMAEMRPPADGKFGSLYRLDPDGAPVAVLPDVGISNSLCWSPDGSRMYFADSPANRIEVFDVDTKTGDVSNRELFAQTSPGIHPDGSCVDADGYVWNAQWGASRVARYAPDGRLDRELELPCSQPSCPTFGGPDLDHLFVTTARVDLSEPALEAEPLAGQVLIFRTPFRGLPEVRARADYALRRPE